MRLIKKLLSVFMTLLVVLLTGIQAFAGSSLEDALNKVNLYVKQDKGAQLLTWKGVIDSNNFAPAVIVYKAEDGKEYPAYCANPNRPGVEDLSAKTYDVDVDQLDTDPAVWGVITNGYPYKSPQELGVNTEYEAYYATKMAVWAVVHNNYSNLDDWKANGNQNAHVEKAMKDLVAIG
ncbi:MAG TPA: thioester domain-containing protein, partial [Candidatus Coprocola pullicola]|nr:thioester domain-containing protein [Candidatus Coprocola pullicola]